MFGTVGLSRRNALAGKECKYQSLHDLVEEYRRSYRECGHVLHDVRLSSVVPHEPEFSEVMTWKHFALDVETCPSSKEVLQKYWKTVIALS